MRLLAWCFGISLAFAGLVELSFSLTSGVLFLFMSALVLPPPTRLARELLGIKIPTEVRVGLFMMVSVLAGVISNVERQRRKSEEREAFKTALELGTRALVYLNDTELLERAVLYLQLLNNMSEHECGMVAKGLPSLDSVLSAIDSLDPGSRLRWKMLAVEARRELAAGGEPQLVSQAQVVRAVDWLAANATDADAAALAHLDELDAVTPEEACAGINAFYRLAIRAPAVHRRILLRLAVQPE